MRSILLRRCDTRIVDFVFLLLAVALCFSRSFSQLALGRSKFVGNEIEHGPAIPSNFPTYWDQVTPGNDGKWGSVEGTRGVFNWKSLDAIYNFALTNGLLFKEHTLLWAWQQPSWVSSLDSASQRAAVEAWIDSVGHRYPKMDFVDVLNEPLTNPPDGRNGAPNYIRTLGGTGATGWDWVVTAFTWARKYCAPGVRLLINQDYVLQSSEVTSNYIALVDTLKTRRLIDGIGIEGHYDELKDAAYLGSRYVFPIDTLKSNLERIASATGLPIYITEFDIDEEDDNTQLENYKTYFPLFYEDPGVKGMTLWGYRYNETWKPYIYLDSLGVERPALRWLRTYLAERILTEFSLSQNYPNPFNPSTTIRFDLPQRGHVRLTVFNVLGQKVAELVNAEQEAGYHTVQFSAEGESASGGDGRRLSSGVYFYRLQVRSLDPAGGGTESFVETKKLILLR